MKSTIITSIIGILVFIIIMRFLYTIANGKRKMPESKRDVYVEWTAKYGKTLKRGIIIISIVYGIGMLIQIVTLLIA